MKHAAVQLLEPPSDKINRTECASLQSSAISQFTIYSSPSFFLFEAVWALVFFNMSLRALCEPRKLFKVPKKAARMLRTIRNRTKRDKDPRILILGLDNAGKTTILKKLGGDNQEPDGPTQGFNIKQLRMKERTAKLCDLGGQRALREFWSDYYQASDCLMFVVDSSDLRRLEEAHETFNEVVQNMPRVPILVFANKQDLATSKPPSVVAEALQLVECRDRKWQIQGCSAKTGEGLEEGISWIMSNC